MNIDRNRHTNLGLLLNKPQNNTFDACFSLGVQLQPKEMLEIVSYLVGHIFTPHVLYLCYSVDDLGNECGRRSFALEGGLKETDWPISLREQIGQRNFSDDITYTA
jgi:hypothetical protein